MLLTLLNKVNNIVSPFGVFRNHVPCSWHSCFMFLAFKFHFSRFQVSFFLLSSFMLFALFYQRPLTPSNLRGGVEHHYYLGSGAIISSLNETD